MNSKLVAATWMWLCLQSAIIYQRTNGAEPDTARWSGFQNGGQLVAASPKLPLRWSESENIAWKSPISGYGQSSPVVDHDQLVVTSVSGANKEQFHISAYRLSDGHKNWQRDFVNPTKAENNNYISRAAPSPTCDGDGYYAFCEGGLVVAVDRIGNPRWQRDLVAEYGPIEARHGLASSLEQSDKHLFVWVERSEAPYIMALDKETGKNVWKSEGLGATTWCSPRLVAIGSAQHLVCSASGKLVGLDPATGSKLWEFAEIANNTSCTPIPLRDDRFLIGASEGRSEASPGKASASNGVIKVSLNADKKYEVAYVWQAKKATCSFGSPVIVANRAIFVNRVGVLYQLDADSGNELSAERVKSGSIWATPITAGDHLYLFGQKGTTSVMSLSTGKSIAENTLWSAPTEAASEAVPSGQVLYAAAAAEDRLILRTGSMLYCVQSAN